MVATIASTSPTPRTQRLRVFRWSPGFLLLWLLTACSEATIGPALAGGSGGGSGSDIGGSAGSNRAGTAGVGNAGGATSFSRDGAPETGESDASDGGAFGGAGGAGGTSGADGSVGMGGFGYGGPPRCATAGAPLCETFENGLDTALWSTTQVGDASIAVDAIHAARGAKALHVKTTAGVGHSFITERRTFPAVGNDLYVRMFVWFEDDITTSGHFTLAEGAGTGNGALVRFGGQFMEFGVGSDLGASGDWTDHDNVIIPSKKWLCVEFQFQGSSNAFHVWSEDVPRTALDTGASRHNGFVMPQFTSLWFGWWMYNATEPQDLWIDEIVVDYKPIGCAK